MTKSTLRSTRRGRGRLLVGIALAVSLLALAGPAQARAHAKHHHHHTGGGAASGGGPAIPPSIVVSASPDPVVESGPSTVMTTVQVEASPAFSGDIVNVSSTQMASSCGLVYFVPYQGNFGENVNLVLDNDGNATVIVIGEDCPPGSDVIEADLTVAPYDTALTTLVVQPPVATPPGLTGYPNPEVEVGTDNGVGNNDIGNSDIFTVFQVETSPVYAEQPVEISSPQLEAGCGQGWVWISPNPGGQSESGVGINLGPTSPGLPYAILDDDGNAVFGFWGRSCAAETAEVTADVEAGTHPTYVTSYTVEPPAPTI